MPQPLISVGHNFWKNLLSADSETYKDLGLRRYGGAGNFGTARQALAVRAGGAASKGADVTKRCGATKNSKKQADEELQKRVAVINDLVKSLEKRMKGDETRASLGDFIRLLQLQRELQDDMPRDIEVTWIDPET